MCIANCERDEPDAVASIACKAAQMRVEPKRLHRPAEVGVILISWQIPPSKNSCSPLAMSTTLVSFLVQILVLGHLLLVGTRTRRIDCVTRNAMATCMLVMNGLAITQWHNVSLL